jgi:ribonuclease P protein subunit POP4
MATDVVRQELIGRSIEVVASRNPSVVGVRGTVVDETKNTIRVRTPDGDKTLLKEQVTVAVEIDGARYRIDGTLLTRRPDKRITT